MSSPMTIHGAVAASGQITTDEGVASISGIPFKILSVFKVNTGDYLVRFGMPSVGAPGIGTSEGVDPTNRSIQLTQAHTMGAPVLLYAVELSADAPNTNDNQVHVKSFDLAGQPVDASFDITIVRNSI